MVEQPLPLVYGHSTSPLPLELQYHILESAEWYQHPTLSRVCKAWRMHLSRPRNRAKLYKPLTRSASSILGRNINPCEPPRIHRAIAHQNMLRWDNQRKKFTWAHIDIEGHGQKHAWTLVDVDSIPSRKSRDLFNMSSFLRQPAFCCCDTGNPVTVGLFISKYRSAQGSFCTPQRLMLNEVMTVGKFLNLMHKWRSDDRKYRAKSDGNPINWILCNYFVANHGENLIGDRYLSVTVEMEQDKPEELAFRARMFAERLELDFDRNFLRSRIAM
ncbi:hypothetical protein Dda_6550 [Drechslerella dactyloides]|uniref:F-box domain-containing protein n=1 Tax=Drechslerella dactyloides TaxID=74499 RepID=A0AAD6IY06_DREDA|nr:hypothetical protein Dda_6550 [Drechslerella dactyloides]